MVDTKVCTKCGEEKGVSEFHKDGTKKSGLRSNCKKCHSISHKKYREKSPEKISKLKREYYLKNQEKYRAYFRRHYRKNKYSYQLRDRLRLGILKQQTPDWLTPIDNIVMKHIYATCPEGYHVDHIVPLKSDKVSGLNVPWNLQHLPAEENIAKGNRYWPDMWEYDDG